MVFEQDVRLLRRDAGFEIERIFPLCGDFARRRLVDRARHTGRKIAGEPAAKQLPEHQAA